MFKTIGLGQKTNILIGGTSGWKVDVNQLLNRAQVPFLVFWVPTIKNCKINNAQPISSQWECCTSLDFKGRPVDLCCV